MAKILIIDDEADVVEFQKSYLARRKHEVSIARNTAEALEAIKNNPFDIIFCDLRIDTDTSGLDILEEAKKHSSCAVFYIVTGVIDRQIENRAMESGAKEVLHKPVPNQVLDEKIKESGF